ncbi:MAG: SRPBCC domain-containing protein, partial [Steroidobacteraceae bacterium]
MALQTRGYAHRVDIRAGIDEVWRSLTEPERLSRWLASQARVDAREGGSYWLQVDAKLTREAH